MSVVAVGPALDLDGPLPVAPEYSLLSIPGVVVADGGRWLNGVNVDGYPCDVPSLWEPCSEGTFRTKSDESDQPSPRFDSFVVYLPITCSSLGMGDPDAFANRAERALEATLSFGVEQGLSQGVVGSLNPFFGDTNATLLAGGAAVTPEVGLRYLEDAIGATGRKGMIHATPATVAAWEFEALRTNSILETVNGTPVASGGGYIGADPAAGASPAAGQAWAFATGPVEVRLAGVTITAISETLDRSDNTVTFRAERFVLPLWDGCLQAAVLIDWTP
jgi:hypothetical protein